MPDKPLDPNVAECMYLLRTRAKMGRAKYGTDTTRDDYSLENWLDEIREEALDMAVYATAAKAKLRRMRKGVKGVLDGLAEIEDDTIDG
jgi:phage terminase large subunit GpA-like protein